VEETPLVGGEGERLLVDVHCCQLEVRHHQVHFELQVESVGLVSDDIPNLSVRCLVLSHTDAGDQGKD